MVIDVAYRTEISTQSIRDILQQLSQYTVCLEQQTCIPQTEDFTTEHDRYVGTNIEDYFVFSFLACG